MTTTEFSESDLTAKGRPHLNASQSRKLGMFLDRSNLSEMVEHPHLGFGSNPAKLHRCVNKVKRKGGVRNPWAVCNAAIGVLLLSVLPSCGLFAKAFPDVAIPVSEAHVVTDKLATFPNYDLNGDGEITSDEVDTFISNFLLWVASNYAMQPAPQVNG